MRVKRGWATDFGKTRFDVEVDETDLLGMLAERGCDDPEAARKAMPGKHAYQIMNAEAMTFVHHSLAKQEAAQGAQHMAKAAEFIAERNALLDKYTASAF
jgi:hypothetical protein